MHQTPVFELILPPGKSESDALTSSFPVPKDWHANHQEGQLAVDVYETQSDIVVIAPLAGGDANRIEVYIHNDLLTIRGVRSLPLRAMDIVERYTEECFWGVCSRTVVLPVHVRGDAARAEFRQGLLTVVVPKIAQNALVPITVVDE